MIREFGMSPQLFGHPEPNDVELVVRVAARVAGTRIFKLLRTVNPSATPKFWQ